MWLLPDWWQLHEIENGCPLDPDFPDGGHLDVPLRLLQFWIWTRQHLVDWDPKVLDFAFFVRALSLVAFLGPFITVICKRVSCNVQ